MMSFISYLKRLFLPLFISTFLFDYVFGSAVVIENNQYKGILIGIHHSVPENGSDELLDAIKEAWTNASRDLFVATEKRAYFGEITILVPKSWNASIYEAAENECYNHADAVIAPENPIFGDIPYTTQYGGCGERGERIYFTPRYMTESLIAANTGARGKNIAHEWAHYRWGVFDEVSYVNPFYLDPDFVNPVPTGCPSHVVQSTGTVYNYVHDRPCDRSDIDTSTNNYSDECVYLPESNTTANVSLMSYGYLDQVITFCKDDHDSDVQNQHNVRAPNDQNRLCNLKSTWTVIMESPDFLNGKNARNDSIIDTTPTFKIVQTKTEQRYVLVLDVSGSMDIENRLDNMRVAANYFINTALPNGSLVGLVKFSTVADIVREMTVLNTEESRKNLASALPKYTESWTSIGNGIQKGLEVLKHQSAAGGSLIVFTDGEENTEKYIRDVYQDVIKQKVKVDAVFLATTANEILVNLTYDTGGQWFYDNDNNQESLINSFNEISVKGDCESTSSTYQLLSESFTLEYNKSDVYSSTVFIDSSVGQNTVFTFTWSKNYVKGISFSDVIINSPSCTYSNQSSSLPACLHQTIQDVSPEFLSLRILIPGIAEIGLWSYSVRVAHSQKITVVVSSMASNNGVDPIEVTTNIISDTVLPPKLFASVTQGHLPVLESSVIAVVERPSGDSVMVELLDNGAGCDIRANDGIYSRYFTSLTEKGRYSVKIQTSQNASSQANVAGGSTSTYKSGTVDEDGKYTLNPKGVKSPLSIPSQGATVSSFARVKSAGGFSSTRSVNSSKDTFPPGQVTDMTITQTDIQNFDRGLTVQFTAPGDDYDSGTATSYDLRYTYGKPSSLLNDFDAQAMVNQGDVVKGSLLSPVSAGNKEILVINLSRPTNNASVISVAVKAKDEFANVAAISNIAMTTIYFTPPLRPIALPGTHNFETTASPERHVSGDGKTDKNSHLYFTLMIVFAVTTVILALSTFGLLYHVEMNKAKENKSQKAEFDSIHSHANPYAGEPTIDPGMKATSQC